MLSTQIGFNHRIFYKNIKIQRKLINNITVQGYNETILYKVVRLFAVFCYVKNMVNTNKYYRNITVATECLRSGQLR